MGNELAEPSCPQWVDTAGFTNTSQQWCTCSWNFHTVRGGAVRGDNRFRPRKIGVVDIRKAFCSEDGIVYSPGAGGFTNPSQSVISQLGWGIHTVRGGIDPENHRSPFSSPVCWSRTCVWKDFRSGDGTIPPGWRWVLALRIPGWGFHTVRGGTDPGDNHVRLQYVEVVNVRKDL